MSSRARRISPHSRVIAFPWQGVAADEPSGPAAHAVDLATRLAEPEAQPPVLDGDAHLAALEREAFAKGYEHGERSGLAAASERGAATLQRLTQTLEDLTTLRGEMIRSTERQLVQLALAVARRIVHREISLDADLLIAMARVALDRLGDSASVTVRLHPDEYQATGAGGSPVFGAHVKVVADASVGRGGCRVESDFGTLEPGVDAQIQELGRALLGEGDGR